MELRERFIGDGLASEVHRKLVCRTTHPAVGPWARQGLQGANEARQRL